MHFNESSILKTKHYISLFRIAKDFPFFVNSPVDVPRCREVRVSYIKTVVRGSYNVFKCIVNEKKLRFSEGPRKVSNIAKILNPIGQDEFERGHKAMRTTTKSTDYLYND